MENQTPPMKRYLKAAALSAVRSGDIKEAIDKYRQYLELNPQDYDAWAGLGGAQRRMEDLVAAIESYEKAYEINPKSTYALVNIVALRAARGNEDDKEKLKEYIPIAKQLIQEIIDSGDADYWNWYDLATLQMIEGDTDAAISTFNYAADLTPKTATENFLSVIKQLTFLQQNIPNIPGLSQIIENINRRMTTTT
jgi:tetratricopeptide (TPR) repeat protein